MLIKDTHYIVDPGTPGSAGQPYIPASNDCSQHTPPPPPIHGGGNPSPPPDSGSNPGSNNHPCAEPNICFHADGSWYPCGC